MHRSTLVVGFTLLAVCFASFGCQFGGAVVPEGRGFVYACVAAAGADASCNEAPGVEASNAEVQLPERFAVGSTFRVLFLPQHAAGGGAPLAVASESKDVLERVQSGFRVARPGSIALAAFAPSGEVLGRARLDAFAIDHVGFDRFTSAAGQSSGEQAVARVRFERLGERTTLRTVPMNAEGDVLAGALPCAWSSSDPSVVSIEGPTNGNFVRVVAGGAGVATLHVDLGDAKADIAVTVARD